MMFIVAGDMLIKTQWNEILEVVTLVILRRDRALKSAPAARREAYQKDQTEYAQLDWPFMVNMFGTFL